MLALEDNIGPEFHLRRAAFGPTELIRFSSEPYGILTEPTYTRFTRMEWVGSFCAMSLRAKRSNLLLGVGDCFVVALLAMT